MKFRNLITAVLLINSAFVFAQDPATDLLGGGGIVRTDAAPTWTRTLVDANFTWDVANNKLYYNSTASATWTEFKAFADLTSGQIFVGGAGNTSTAVTPSGAVAVSNTGVFTMTASAINDKVNGLDIAVVSGAIEVDPDLTELTDLAATPAAGDYFMIYDLDVTTHKRVNYSDVVKNFANADLTATAARAHLLVDNTAVALTLGSTGQTNTFTLITTDAAEGIAYDAPGGVTYNPFGTSAGNTSEIRFAELAANGTNYTGFKSPDALAANVIYTLPNADATIAGQVLTSNAAGVLSWSTAAANTNIIANSLTQTAATTQTLLDNTAAALTFGAAGATSMMVFNTTDAAEAVEFGNAITVTGTATMNGNVNIGNAATDELVIADNDVVFTNLQAFANDAAAGTGGVPAKGLYQLSSANTYGLPAGVAMFKQ